MVGVVRFELTTPCTQNRCASQATPHSVRIILAEQTGPEPATSAVTGRRSNQLSYCSVVRLDGLEPSTFSLSEKRSNQLSYKRLTHKQELLFLIIKFFNLRCFLNILKVLKSFNIAFYIIMLLFIQINSNIHYNK